MKMKMKNRNHAHFLAPLAALTMPISLYGIMVSSAITVAQSTEVNEDDTDCMQ